jgi:hypothetical protein
MTTARFKPLVFSVSGFALSYIANMFILMILYDFCVSPAKFCYVIAYIGQVESRVQIAGQCESWKNYPSLHSPGTDRTENVSSIIACYLIAGKTCPQNCSPATVVVLSPVYTAAA